jgi:hypothetical protein
MTRSRYAVTLVAVAVFSAAPLFLAGCTNKNGDVSDLGADTFPCTLATHAEVRTVVDIDVVSHSLEPDGVTCIYHYGAAGAPGTFDIAVTDATPADRDTMAQVMGAFGQLTAGADMGARKLDDVGDLAFESETPGYSGRVDFFKGGKEVQITCDLPRRLTREELDRLVTFAQTVAGKV